MFLNKKGKNKITVKLYLNRNQDCDIYFQEKEITVLQQHGNSDFN